MKSIELFIFNSFPDNPKSVKKSYFSDSKTAKFHLTSLEIFEIKNNVSLSPKMMKQIVVLFMLTTYFVDPQSQFN